MRLTQISLAFTSLCLASAPLAAQSTSGTAPDSASPARGGRGSGRPLPALDTVRARQLYVSRDPKDLPGCANRGLDPCGIKAKHTNDSTWMANAAGRYDMAKVTYKSDVDGLDIPAYVFSPLNKS